MTENGWTGHDGHGSQRGQPSRGWAAGLRFGDRYEVERLIGEGGWAETYQGRDLLLGRVVALKLLRTQFAGDPALVDRFEREARIAAAISHPHVVTVYDYGTQDGTFFIALQFIAGEDLKQLVVRRGRLPIEEAVGVTRAILSGLGAIHRAGIVHRDVKPQNVLIGDDGLIRITDFGIAHQSLATRVTTHGDAMGTAAYMAPEQAQGDDVSPATDIYALGVVLFELLTGRLPFNRGHAMAILLAHLQQMPESPSAVAPDAHIPPWLDGVVLRAMAKSPNDRFASAAEMLGALDATDLVVASPGITQRQAAGAGHAATTARMAGVRPAGLTVPGAGAEVGAGARAATAPRSRQGSGEAPPRPHRSPGRRKRPSRLGRNIALLLLLLAAFGIAGAAAANMFGGDGAGLFGGGDGDDSTASAVATVRSNPALPTPTGEAEPDEEPTQPPEPTATTEQEPTVTRTPSPPTTVPPTRTATVVPPTRTATVVPPTRTATVVPTTIPTATTVATEPPSTATFVPESPTETPVPVEEPPPIRQATETTGVGRTVGAGEPIVLGTDAWTGGAGKKNDEKPRGNGNGAGGNDVASVEARSGPKSEAVVAFSLAEVPTGGVTIEVQTRIERPEDGPALLAIAVNDATTSSPLDISATGEEWGVVEIPVDAEILVAGENRIVVTAQEVEGARGKAAVILLGDVTVMTAGSETGGADPVDAAVDDPSTETPAPVVEDGAAPPPASGSGQPTISPVDED